jgi:hypothetical protein
MTEKIKPKFFMIKLEDKDSREIFPEDFFKPDGIFWDKNNQGFYFSVMKTSDPVNETAGADFLYYYDLKTNGYGEINLNWEAGLMEPYLLVKNDGFLARWRLEPDLSGEDTIARLKSLILKKSKASIIPISTV